MRAALRLSVAFLLTGFSLGPAPTLAQNSDASTETPAADAVGPRELENFSIQGTVTRQAEQPPAAQQPARTPPAASVRNDEPRVSPTGSNNTRRVEPREVDVAEAPDRRSPDRSTDAPRQSSVTVSLPPASGVTSVPPSTELAPADQNDGLGPAGDSGAPIWPWLLAAMILGAGGTFLFMRSRHREAYAGGPTAHAFVAPEPRAPVPQPAPIPQPAGAPAPEPIPSGIVSTRLRPWIDLTFEPRRCVVEDERVTFEFDLSMMNSGTAPARNVLIEASTFNAGPTQDQEIEAFFSNPIGEGERIAAIPPLKSFNLRTQVTVARSQVRVLEAGGRHVFVPLMAFNAIYSWGGGEGQTSEAFLLGRDTQGEKMAPFRLDLGAHVFREVGKRSLPAAVRR